MEQVKLDVQVKQQVEIECKMCGYNKLCKCKAELRKELICNTIFISGSGISMIGFSLAVGSGLSFIGLGLTFGTISFLVSSLV
jgi:hypothetical protein